eukprot:TRINITY_DN13371_c0_g1_i1.p1 TRINITY_DN13371_c0_g1~~TRINITY_DN13371_c0_g1_i1.p1  ORF type:complete len:166 (-),score=36.52 TRINITY_DN13371_c0_g1_i1:34-531(-)
MKIVTIKSENPPSAQKGVKFTDTLTFEKTFEAASTPGKESRLKFTTQMSGLGNWSPKVLRTPASRIGPTAEVYAETIQANHRGEDNGKSDVQNLVRWDNTFKLKSMMKKHDKDDHDIAEIFTLKTKGEDKLKEPSINQRIIDTIIRDDTKAVSYTHLTLPTIYSV